MWVRTAGDSFSRYLAQGRYFGVDVWDEGVAWCANHIARANKNFSFHCLDSDNNYYFEEYRPDIRNAYSLPFVEDSSIDLVFAISVLTHLVADDCESYLSEIARALKSNGAAYLSIFIIDQYFFDYVKKTGLYTGVRKVKKGVYQAYKGQDFFAGYTEDKWRSLLRKHGLKAVSHEVGSWAEKPGARNYQDTFVVVRK